MEKYEKYDNIHMYAKVKKINFTLAVYCFHFVFTLDTMIAKVK